MPQDGSPAKLFPKASQALPYRPPVLRLGSCNDQVPVAGPPEARHLLLTPGRILPIKSAESPCPLVVQTCFRDRPDKVTTKFEVGSRNPKITISPAAREHLGSSIKWYTVNFAIGVQVKREKGW